MPKRRAVAKGKYMRNGFRVRRYERDRAATMMTLPDAIEKVLELAEPMEAIEISLSEAIGLVLAEPVIADVDLPPFDRAGTSGYAVQASEAFPGSLLRVADPWHDHDSHTHEIDTGESARVEPGDALPVGADAVLTDEEVRVDGGEAQARVIEVLAATEPGNSVIRRGTTLPAGSVLADAGTRITPAMVALFASQGAIHPICHRRVRVSILAVGDHLVGPSDAPVLHHERNASNLAISSLLLGLEAMVQDLGSVPEANFAKTLDRGLNAPVVLILGRLNGEMCRTLAHAGVEPLITGFGIECSRISDFGHGVVRDEDERVVTHVIHLSLDPVSALSAVSLYVLPLIARLQGDFDESPRGLSVIWDGRQPATGGELRPVPAILVAGSDARLRARPVVEGGPIDLPDLARATGFAIFEPNQGPWIGGEVISFLPFNRSFARSES
jgi:molybdopterin biosynthesis enzyme